MGCWKSRLWAALLEAETPTGPPWAVYRHAAAPWGAPATCLPQISPVPQLRGHFPLNLTVVLRALALHHITSSAAGSGAAAVRSLVSGKGRRGGAGGDAAAAEARDSLVALFSRPLFAEGPGRQGLLQQVRHLFGFALEHLAGAGAIGPQGEPLGEWLRCRRCLGWVGGQPSGCRHPS